VSIAEPPHTLLILLPPRRKLAIVGAILLTLFLASLDQTVVGTALPRIITDLNGANLYAWVVTVYLLTSTITVPIYGKFSYVFGLSFIVGPLIGGWITDNISWHWVFYVNVPVGIASLIVLSITLPGIGRRTASARDLDYLGIVVFTGGVVPLMIGLSNKGYVNGQGQLANWTDLTVGGLTILGPVF